MKKIFVVALLALILPAVLHARPVAYFQEISHNFGTISHTDKAEHVFEIINKGDQELVIEKISSS